MLYFCGAPRQSARCGIAKSPGNVPKKMWRMVSLKCVYFIMLYKIPNCHFSLISNCFQGAIRTKQSVKGAAGQRNISFFES